MDRGESNQIGQIAIVDLADWEPSHPHLSHPTMVVMKDLLMLEREHDLSAEDSNQHM